MGRPIAQMLIFISLSLVLVHLTFDEPLPNVARNVSISSEETTFEATPVNQTTGDKVMSFVSCIPFFHFFTGEGFVCDLIQNTWSDTIGQTTVGKAITTVTEGLGDFVRMMARIMAFDFPCDGATTSHATDCPPSWIEYPFVIVIVGLTSYITVSLVRGAG